MMFAASRPLRLQKQAPSSFDQLSAEWKAYFQGCGFVFCVNGETAKAMAL
jgi:hypothetical protein